MTLDVPATEIDANRSWASRGWAAPVRVLSSREAWRLGWFLKAHHKMSLRRLPSGYHVKEAAAWSSWLYRLATRPEFVALARDHIGDDVVLWGASLVGQGPGKHHAWHSDCEVSDTAPGTTVNIWVALHSGGPGSSLSFLPGSHRAEVSVQQARAEAGLGRDSLDDRAVADLASRHHLDGTPERVIVMPGEAVAFDGRAWHATENHTGSTRRALLLQYARPDAPLFVPQDANFDWPFARLDRPVQCVLASGVRRPGPNELVDPPRRRLAPRTRVPALVEPLELEPAADGEHRSQPLLQGPTGTGLYLTSHVSSLAFGHRPHPPHRHREEEVIVILGGAVDVTLADSPQSTGTTRRLEAGGLVYHPLDQHHTITGASIEAARYAIVKWHSSRISRAGEALGAMLADRIDPPSNGDRRSGLEVMSGQTRYLRRLQVHRSTMPVGAGYEPHTDPYDVVLVTLDGDIETLGTSVGPEHLVWYPMGSPHGLRNVGDSDAHYVAIELHGANFGSLLNGIRLRSILRRTRRRAARLALRRRT